MLNILVNAYAMSPSWGSEPGMGWNWVVNLARYCRLFVITEGEWQSDIESALAKLPQRENLHFYYNPVSDKVRQMCWNQGDWRFYWHYRKWQKRTLKIAQQIIAENHIDIIHQLNMIGFREPGYLWKIKKIPLVWGPVGGMELMPTNYVANNFKQKLFCILKNSINTLQYKFQPRVRHTIKRSNAIIAAVKGVQDVLRDYYNINVPLINETGTTLKKEVSPYALNKDLLSFNILWVGKFDFRKQLGLAIKTVAEVNDKRVKLHICGTGNESQEKYYRELATNYNIAEQCHWHGKVEHDKILHMMAKSDLFLFTSIMEATSTVVLEAISVGLPILSFNTCGFGPLVKDFAGETIELTNPDQSVQEFAEKIKYFVSNRKSLEAIKQQEIAHREGLSWDSKARQVVEIYKQLTRNHLQ